MLKRSCLAALLLLAASSPARAQSTGYYFTYADLEKIFVENQQYFVLDDDGFDDPSMNHLHFTRIDTTTGAFTGEIWAPVLVPAIAAQTLPVAGQFVIHSDVGHFGIPSGQGLYYEIQFSWEKDGICQSQVAAYDGAITFRGYIGGKMQANIGGMITSTWYGCGIDDLPYSPQPFSGVLVK